MGRFAGGEFGRECPRDRVQRTRLHNHDQQRATNLYRPSSASSNKTSLHYRFAKTSLLTWPAKAEIRRANTSSFSSFYRSLAVSSLSLSRKQEARKTER